MWPSASFCPAAAPARGEAAGVGNGEDVADQEGHKGERPRYKRKTTVPAW
ncbi:hypothetical protein GGER_04860 [Serratia rubidaea]